MDQMLKLQNRLLRDYLRKARTMANLNQTEVAAQFGRKQPFIARIESGSRQVAFVELEQFAKIYGKPVSFFETREEVERVHGELINPVRVLHDYPDWFGKKRNRGRP